MCVGGLSRAGAFGVWSRDSTDLVLNLQVTGPAGRVSALTHTLPIKKRKNTFPSEI